MTFYSFAWFVMIFIAGISAFGILLVKKVLHAALLLILCLMSIAALYLLVGAEFLGVSQIMIYAGGILVLILFGIMLTSRILGRSPEVGNRNLTIGALVSAGFFALLVISINSASLTLVPSGAVASYNNVEQIGILLMSDQVLAFELAGLLLLISLIGAAVTVPLSKRKTNAGH